MSSRPIQSPTTGRSRLIGAGLFVLGLAVVLVGALAVGGLR